MTATFHDYLQAAGYKDPPPWSRQVVMPHAPLKHQIEALRQGLTNTRFKDLSDPGTGKTVPALALALARASQGNRTVYLTQPKLTEQARLALEQWFPGHPLKVDLFQGNIKQRQSLVDRWDASGWPDILFTTYKFFVGWSPPRGRGQKEGREPHPVERVNYDALKQRGYTMLIVDEAVVLKKSSSKIHKAVAQFVGQPGPESNGLWLMTGSPVENNPKDAFGLIHLVEPTRYSTERRFDVIHLGVDCSPRGFQGCPKGPRFYTNLDYLHKSLMRYGRRVTKREVTDLPEITVTDVPVVLSSTHKLVYDKIVNELLLELDDGTLLDFTQTQKLYQATQRMLVCPESVTQTHIADNALLETLDELLATLEGHKVMVGVWYHDSISKLMERYKHLNPAFISGDLASSKVEGMKTKFVEDPTCQVIFTNYRSGGVGVDGLQAVCSYAIMLEMVTVPGWYDQWISRLHRTGQTEPITVYLVYVRGTISATLRRNLLTKEALNNEVVKDKKRLLQELLNESNM